MSEIRLQNVKKKYGPVEVIHGVDIDIKDGEFVVFVGPSGCGKSTLLRMVAGLEEISGGDLVIDNQVVNHLPPKDRGIAMVFQSYALYPHMTVFKNMAFGLKLAKSNKGEIEKRVREAARILQLEPYLDRRPSELSGGQRQRVAIGRAIVRNPKVFLFDEPLSNLDAALRVQTRIEIAKLHQDLKSTIIYVTHDQVEAMTLADKIVVLQGGNVEQIGSPMELYHKPRNKFVAGFIGSPAMNFIDVSKVTFGDGFVAKDAAAYVGVRPEHLVVGGRGACVLNGKVDLVERLGDVSYLYVTLDSGDNIIASIPGTSEASAGDHVSLSTDATHIHQFGADDLAL